MDDLLARERASEENLRVLLKQEETPIKVLLAAFEEHRNLAQDVMIHDLPNAETHENRLWACHTEARQSLARTLKRVRKSQDQQAVGTRIAIEMYLRFIKQTIRFYRGHIYKLSTTFGGIPELQAVARQVKPVEAADGSLNAPIPPESRKLVLHSCHRTLIYLGDLCRYRATDNLDKEQDFGPAIGFYGLACTIRPESGWGHHQLAVVALEQKSHLRAIYHLYRSILVAQPVKLATNNLKIEFEKSNAAWDKGELIEKGPPNDLDAGKKALFGWFVRLHSMCAKGELFRGYDELERELFSRLSRELRQRSLDANLMRMVFVNLSAQHIAMENYRDTQIQQNEQAFYSFMRINVLFFTTLLRLLYDDLVQVISNPDLVGAELTDKLTPVMARVLPALRLYNFWLLTNSHLVLGLMSNEFLAPSINEFWRVYTSTLDLVMVAFPIWDLEDSPQATYMLEEDADALGFQPLIDPTHGLSNKLWYTAESDTLKARFNDQETSRLSGQEEMLMRLLSFLETGSYVANNVDNTPVNIKGARFVLGDAEPAVLPLPPPPPPPPTASKAAESRKPKIMSYAAAAANGNTKTGKVPVVVPNVAKKQSPAPPKSENQAQSDAQLTRMVDDLVDEDDGNHPVTPPQQNASDPAVMTANGEVYAQGVPHLASGFQYASGKHKAQSSIPITPGKDIFGPTPRSKNSGDAIESVSGLWPSSPATAATGFATRHSPRAQRSPAHDNRAAHNRNTSTSSIRSNASRGLGESWASVDSTSRPRHMTNSSLSNGSSTTTMRDSGLGNGGYDGSLTANARNSPGQNKSPLLFGAGNSVWSALPTLEPKGGFGG